MMTDEPATITEDEAAHYRDNPGEYYREYPNALAGYGIGPFAVGRIAVDEPDTETEE